MRASISWPVPLPVRFTISPPAEIGCHARPELQTVLVVDFSAIAQDPSMISQPVSGPWTPSDSSMRGHQCRVEQVTSTIKYRIQTKAGDDPKGLACAFGSLQAISISQRAASLLVFVKTMSKEKPPQN